MLVAEALAAARTFAAKNNYDIVPNQEFCAMGLANIASGLFGGMIVGGGMSGTAANDSAGARTQLSTITSSVFVGLTLVYLLPLFRDLPKRCSGQSLCTQSPILLMSQHSSHYAQLTYRKYLGGFGCIAWRFADGNS